MAIITISRQAGSLGDEIARALAADMGYKLVGRQDFKELAEKYEPEFAAKLERVEREQGLTLLERLFFSTPIYLSLYEAFIFELASQRQVIILGRGSQIVLGDVHQVYRVRVVAPTHMRVIHLRQEHGMSTDEALEFIRKHDQSRRNLIRQLFDQDPRNWSLYDMILNTARMDAAAGVAILKTALGEVMRLQPMEEVPGVLMGLALGKRVEAKVREKVLPSRDIEVVGDPDGTVTLIGTISAKEDVVKAEAVAKEYPGVTGVINNLKTSTFIYGY